VFMESTIVVERERTSHYEPVSIPLKHRFIRRYAVA
jgi:hypothetical protein